MGGEPLLHPQVYEFCQITRRYFQKSSIVLVSNGILLHQLTDELIEKFNNINIELCVSNYGLGIDMNKFNKFKYHYFHNKNLMYNIGLDLSGNQPIDDAFRRCDHV